jgi:hypothetical protein
VDALLPALAALAALAAQAEPPQVGSFKIAFTEHHPLASIREYTSRCRWTPEQIKKIDPAGGVYDLAQESFQVHVPERYRPGTPWGLLVSISAGNDGSVPSDWTAILSERQLLWIGANQSGNERLVWYRTNLALDAVHNMKKRYTIDEERIYVTGESGGGRSASRTALGYPDVFSGGIFMIGCDYFRNVKTLEPGKNGVFPAAFPEPGSSLLGRAKSEGRFVILTGEKDMNRIPCESMAKAFRDDRFVHLTLLLVPGMGHERPVGPNAPWFEKALGTLDLPLGAKSGALFEASQKAEAQGKLGEAVLGYEKSLQRGRGGPTEGLAREALRALREKRDMGIAAAKADAEAMRYEAALAALGGLVRQYGEAASGEAAALLRKLQADPAVQAAIKASQNKGAGDKR